MRLGLGILGLKQTRVRARASLVPRPLISKNGLATYPSSNR